MPEQALNRRSIVQEVTCFLFDLDGTLIDSSPCHERAFLGALKSEKTFLAKPFAYEEHKGKSTRETFISLGIEEEELLTKLTLKKQNTYRQMVEDGEVVAFPHAIELLSGLQEHGHRSWVVTGASRRSAEASLRRLELLPFMEALITGDESKRSKPAPDLYLKCLADYALDQRQALAIEDALPGIQSAKAAGLNVLAVNNPELSNLPEYVGTLKDLHDICLLVTNE